MPPRLSHALGSRRALTRAGAALLAIAAVVVIIVESGASSGGKTAQAHPLESMFQDDQYLLYEPTPVVKQTLATLRSLGVDRIRVTVLWRAVAPTPDSATRPAGFVASDPAGYPGFAPYDRLVALAGASGIGVNFDLSAAGPLWAMGGRSPQAHYTDVYEPSAAEFGQFVAAVGRRYDGSYVPNGAQRGALAALGAPVSGPLARVSYWSVWNEPNQPGWLSPQWRVAGGARTMVSPALYRRYVDAAWTALGATGHGPARDTILVGELAPEGGGNAAPAEQPIDPLDFLRALYCVDSSYRPLAGATAGALSCPSAGGDKAFVTAHPGLFDATGFAHHPYSFFLAPNVGYPSTPADAGFVPLVQLSRLENAVDRIYSAYGVSRTIPIYLTEYGYETNPPNPFRGVSLARQAQYIDEAQYMAAQDPRVRSMSQFLLVDAPPDPKYPPGTIGYWSTFQTGLLFASGAPKPSFYAYRLPIWVPAPTFTPGGSVLVWGMLRPAPHNTRQSVQLQWRGAAGAYRTIATVTTNDHNATFSARVEPPGSGFVRIAWRSPSGKMLHSRAAAVQSG